MVGNRETHLSQEANAGSGSNVTELSVSEISLALKRVVEDSFGRVRIRGEIAGYRGPHASGHMYFALKDEKARIEAVIWRGVAGRLKYRPEEGLEVIATGKVTTYPGSSKYQIVIEQLEPAGAGALMALLEERKRKLAAEGLFAAERKQLLPFLPRIVGVVTSPTGAVIRDILHRLTDRFPLHVIVWPVRVQGETSGEEVASAIRGFNTLDAFTGFPRPDVLIVARGGGSIEDLWGFNDEAVVRAAAESVIPLISAVGHETDTTLIDYAADKRAPTPSAAAEMAVPVKADLEATLADLSARLKTGIRRTFEAVRSDLRAASRGLPTPDGLFALKRQHLDQISGRLEQSLNRAIERKRFELGRGTAMFGPSLLTRPVTQRRQTLEYTAVRLHQAMTRGLERNHNRLQRFRIGSSQLSAAKDLARRRLDFASHNLHSSIKDGVERTAQRLSNAARLLGSYSHQNTLARGFALVRDAEGALMSRAASTKPGAAYSVEFQDGRISVIRSGAIDKVADKSSQTAMPQSAKGSDGNKANQVSKASGQGSLFE